MSTFLQITVSLTSIDFRPMHSGFSKLKTNMSVWINTILTIVPNQGKQVLPSGELQHQWLRVLHYKKLCKPHPACVRSIYASAEVGYILDNLLCCRFKPSVEHNADDNSDGCDDSQDNDAEDKFNVENDLIEMYNNLMKMLNFGNCLEFGSQIWLISQQLKMCLRVLNQTYSHSICGEY